MRPGVDVLKVDVPNARETLWTAEQWLGCPSFGAVIVEIWGDPPAVDFTATKRLALRSEARGVPCWLLRRFAQRQGQFVLYPENLSDRRTRFTSRFGRFGIEVCMGNIIAQFLDRLEVPVQA